MMERLSALVLDGDAASLSTISETLAKFNFRAKAALDFIKHGAAKEAELDLVLVEVTLNDMTPGTSANSDLRHHILNELQVPLIAMCSCDDEEALSKCMNLGARFHVLKPLDRKSFTILWNQALDHKSKMSAPQEPTPNSTKNRMVSSSDGNPKEGLILERNDLSDSESNGYEEPKKRNRITWTMDLHEKFLEAVEALGGNEYATPEAILHLMNIKGLTAKHIGSHLQKHRLRHQNATRKPFPELIISMHDKATSESITPRGETDGEVYPLRLWAKMKKRSVDTGALKTDMYTCTAGNCRENTGSLWDRYENKLQGVFSEKKKRWLFMSEHQWPRKNNIVITDEGDRNEAPETTGGASLEISGSSSLLANDQVAENNSEAARANGNVGEINLLEDYRAYLGTSGSGRLLTTDQVRQKGYAEDTRGNDNLRSTSLPQGHGAFTEISGSSNILTNNQAGEINRAEFARDSDHMENINFFEGIVDPDYNASMDFSVELAHLESNDLDLTGPSDGLEDLRDNTCNDALRSIGPISIDEPGTQGTQEQQSHGMEDLKQVDDIAWDDALMSRLINLLDDEPMTEEAAIGRSQDQQSLAPEALQGGDNAWDDDLRSAGMVNLLVEPIVHEATIGDALMDEPVSPTAQDDVLWAWSPASTSGFR